VSEYNEEMQTLMMLLGDYSHAAERVGEAQGDWFEFGLDMDDVINECKRLEAWLGEYDTKRPFSPFLL